MRAQPVPWLTICSSRPRRRARSWVTTPRNSSGTSIDARSSGSQRTPSMRRVSTWGLPTVSSKPSRRMVSTRMASWSSPRPWTSQASGRSVGSTRSDTLPDQLLVEAVLDLAGGEPAAVAPGERRGVDADGEREARLVHRDHRQRAGVVGIGERLADGHVREAGDRDDLAGARRLGRHPVEGLGDVQLAHPRRHDRPVGPAPGHDLAGDDLALVHPADGEAPDVAGGGQVGHERLQRRALGDRGRRDVRPQHVEERLQVLALLGRVERRAAGAGVAVDDREVDLALVGVEVQEELVDLVQHLRHPGVRAVDLVDHQHHRQAGGQGLAQDEAGLRQRPLGGVHQEQHAVDHVEGPLHLAAEVGVAGRVDDVDLDPAVPDGRVLGEDRDALLALQVHRVHHALGHVLVGAEGAGLPEHGVDQGRLPMIDVGHDGHVPDVLASRHEGGC